MGYLRKQKRVAPLALLAALAVGTAACGGGSAASSTPTTTTPTTTAPTTTTTTTASAHGTAGALATQADALCAQVDTVLGDVHHLHLSTPSNLASAPGSISSDVRTLQGAISALGRAGKASGHRHQISSVVGALSGAESSAKAALSDAAAGNLGKAEAAVSSVGSDVSLASKRLTNLDLADCTARAKSSATTSKS